MAEKEIYIKNMVCPRCIAAVRTGLEHIGAEVIDVQLGRATIHEEENISNRAINEVLAADGFERLVDQQSVLLEKIKNTVVELVHHGSVTSLNQPLSQFLEKEMGKEYSVMSKLFSQMEGCTLEQYVIRQKVERAKELISYGNLNLSQIADELGYSSVAHFSNQFKHLTGVTPSAFKSNATIPRKGIDKV